MSIPTDFCGKANLSASDQRMFGTHSTITVWYFHFSVCVGLSSWWMLWMLTSIQQPCLLSRITFAFFNHFWYYFGYESVHPRSTSFQVPATSLESTKLGVDNRFGIITIRSTPVIASSVRIFSSFPTDDTAYHLIIWSCTTEIVVCNDPHTFRPGSKWL